MKPFGTSSVPQRAQADRLQFAPLLGRPAALRVGQERLQVDRQRGSRTLDRARRIAGLQRGLGVGDRRRRLLDVDADLAGDRQPQLAATGDDAVAQRLAQLGEQRAERGIGRGGRAFRPQHVDQLVARAPAIAVHHEVREEEAALPPW
jgi:hypothetical protein